ncbi:MAG: fatty acid desaturase [Alphaproteobacteria bacterium]|nr:fatty acid desaturase [Alphaproteobacteria bacterium]
MSGSSRSWISQLASYQLPDDRQAIIEFVTTVVPFCAACWASWALFQVHPLLAIIGALPASVFLVRLFMLQHDCGHGSMFSSRRVNDWVGRGLGVLTLTPYDYWRFSHAQHHASSGNLDRRGLGDIDTMTVEEYREFDRIGRLKYRLYRHPFVMLGIGPAYMFLLRHRFPTGVLKMGTMPLRSVIATNVGVAVLWAAIIYTLGIRAFTFVYLPIVILSSSLGVWLFFIQHQFDETHWERSENWTREDAALHGSSYYDLPRPLMWLTGNIGIHHVHHLSSRIPFHQLPRVLEDHPELKEIGRLTLWDSLRCIRLTLWDEQAKKLISFSENRRNMPASAA